MYCQKKMNKCLYYSMLVAIAITSGIGNAALLEDGVINLKVTTPAANTAYSALITDDVILFSVASSAASITLPPSSQLNPGKPLEVRKTDSSTNAVTIAGNGSDTVESSASTTLNTQNESIRLVSDGAGKWLILSRRAITDWTSFTPTGTWTTNATYTGQWRRVGDSMEIFAKIATSGAVSGSLTIDVPSGYTIDSNKVTDSGTQACGSAYGQDTGVANYGGTTFVNSTSNLRINGDSANGQWTGAGPFSFGNSDLVTIHCRVPISGWKS